MTCYEQTLDNSLQEMYTVGQTNSTPIWKID